MPDTEKKYPSFAELSEKYYASLTEQSKNDLIEMLMEDIDEEMVKDWYDTCLREEEEQEEPKKPRCQLVGTDGNVFALMGQARRALKDAGQDDKAGEMATRVMDEAKSYDQALMIICEYVDAY